MSPDTDWHYETTKAADYIADHRRTEQHGAIAWEPKGTVLAFINASESNDRRASIKAAQQTIAVVRQRLETKGIKVLGLAGSSDTCAWALLCTTDDIGLAQRAAYDACQIVASADPHSAEKERMAPLDKTGVPIDNKQAPSTASMVFKRLL